ncbi:hypothetical protein WJX82_000433 [Trebouxia sp. C0006]
MERTGQRITQSSSQAEPQVYQQLAGVLATKPSSESTAGSAAAQSTFRVFERGGVMTALGEYVAEANSKPAPVSRKLASASNPNVRKQRHQQILQAEADEAAGRAIQQYMYRAFNDMSGFHYKALTPSPNTQIEKSRPTTISGSSATMELNSQVDTFKILQAEADEAAGRAIQQYVYRAFNDMSGCYIHLVQLHALTSYDVRNLC